MWERSKQASPAECDPYVSVNKTKPQRDRESVIAFIAALQNPLKKTSAKKETNRQKKKSYIKMQQ